MLEHILSFCEALGLMPNTKNTLRCVICCRQLKASCFSSQQFQIQGVLFCFLFSVLWIEPNSGLSHSTTFPAISFLFWDRASTSSWISEAGLDLTILLPVSQSTAVVWMSYYTQMERNLSKRGFLHFIENVRKLKTILTMMYKVICSDGKWLHSTTFFELIILHILSVLLNSIPLATQGKPTHLCTLQE